MIGSTEPPAMAGTGLEPRDEHDLRIWTAIAMWLGGGCSIAAAAMVLGSRSQHFIALWGLVGFCALAATVTFLAFRPASNSALYVLTNIFSTLGALTVCLACLWSGGVRSGLVGMYLIPALYDAYFFRSRQALAHLVINSALVLSPLLYVSSLQGTQFPARATVLVLGMWGMSALVGLRKRNLLMAEMNARRGALSDPLTGLHNLRSLRERAARGEAREGTAVIEIDIDDFKAVNTAYGHTGADELLRAVGAGLLALTGEDDCVARIGGDEFVMLVNGRSPREIELLVAGCASAVRTASAVLAGEDATFTASVGCALWPWDGETFSELLAAADRRMYTAKGSQAHSTVEAGSGRVFGPPGLDPPVRADRDGPLEAPADGPLVAQDDRLGWARDVAGWWARRPANAIAGAVAWIGGAATTLVALLLPYSDTAHAGILAVLIVCAIAMAAFLLTLAPLIGRRAYLLADGLAAPGVVLGVYLTGGIVSPLLPLVLFAVIVAACFTPPRATLTRLLAAVLISASPFVYSDAASRLEFIVRFIAIVTTAGVLVAIILYSRRELARAEADARVLASHDPLTGLANRRAFRRIVSDALIAVGTDPAALLSVSIIDLDNFKRVNDRHGHAAGDRVLKAIASALTAVTRREDTVARIGGDEFALVAAGADSSVSVALGERCLRAVERAAIDAGYGDCNVSATIGFAVAPSHGTTLDGLVEAADSALMRAKQSGKRRVAGAAGQISGDVPRPPVGAAASRSAARTPAGVGRAA